MIPLLASGAASLVNVLVNRVAGSSSEASGNITLDPKAFQDALNRASGGKSVLSPAEQQAAALNQRLLQSPEVSAALNSQPVGSVGSVEVSQDGSVLLQTAQGSVLVPLTLEGRELARQAYAASIVTGATAVDSARGGVQPVLRLPVQSNSLVQQYPMGAQFATAAQLGPILR